MIFTTLRNLLKGSPTELSKDVEPTTPHLDSSASDEERARLDHIRSVVRKVGVGTNSVLTETSEDAHVEPSPIYAIVKRCNPEKSLPSKYAYTYYFIADGERFRTEWQDLQNSLIAELFSDPSLELPDMETLMAEHLARFDVVELPASKEDYFALRTLLASDRELIERDPRKAVEVAQERLQNLSSAK